MTRAEELQSSANQMNQYTVLVREHLHQQYLLIGRKDYVFKTKKISRQLNLPVGPLKWVMYRLQRDGCIERFNKRFYMTSFSKNAAVDIEVQVTLFERLKKKFHLIK